MLYRFDAPLFFANADYFRERVRALARSGDALIVVAAEPITDIDATAGETLRGLNDELSAAGIELAFAELKDPVRDRLRSYGIHDAIGGHRFLPTVGVAVAAYLHDTEVDWLDWEDRQSGDQAHPAGAQVRPEPTRQRPGRSCRPWRASGSSAWWAATRSMRCSTRRDACRFPAR